MADKIDLILEKFSAANIAAYYQGANLMPQMIGEAIFPSKKQVGLKVSWLKGKTSKPMILRQSAFDAMAPTRERGKFGIADTKLAFFREQVPFTEEDRQMLLQIGDANSRFIDTIIENYYNDAADLINGALTSIERMRMQILSSAKIDLTDASSEGLNINVDFGLDSATQETDILSAAQWKNPSTAQPIRDLIEAKRKAGIVGFANAYMSHETYLQMLAADSVHKNIMGESKEMLTETTVKSFVKTNLSINIIVIGADGNDSFLDETGVEHQFFPDGVVTVAPAGILGNTYFGTTPEEADLMATNDKKTNVRIVNTGIAVVSKSSYGPPMEIATVCSMVGLPIITSVDKIHILNVNAGD